MRGPMRGPMLRQQTRGRDFRRRIFPAHADQGCPEQVPWMGVPRIFERWRNAARPPEQGILRTGPVDGRPPSPGTSSSPSSAALNQPRGWTHPGSGCDAGLTDACSGARACGHREAGERAGRTRERKRGEQKWHSRPRSATEPEPERSADRRAHGSGRCGWPRRKSCDGHHATGIARRGWRRRRRAVQAPRRLPMLRTGRPEERKKGRKDGGPCWARTNDQRIMSPLL